MQIDLLVPTGDPTAFLVAACPKGKQIALLFPPGVGEAHAQLESVAHMNLQPVRHILFDDHKPGLEPGKPWGTTISGWVLKGPDGKLVATMREAGPVVPCWFKEEDATAHASVEGGDLRASPVSVVGPVTVH